LNPFARTYASQFSALPYRLIFFSAVLSVVLSLAGCFGSETEKEAEYLIRVGERIVTEVEFTRAFEIAKTAYGHNAILNSDAAGRVKARLMNQMIEELLLLEIAADCNINVSDAELEKAISDIKADYPDNTFEEVLLENAISFNLWKKRLKRRLLMEKVINRKLRDSIVLTPDDITDYYNEHYKGDENETGIEKDIGQNAEKVVPKEQKDVNEMIIKQLKRGKTEEAYTSWIETLKEKYSIDINHKLWKKIDG